MGLLLRKVFFRVLAMWLATSGVSVRAQTHSMLRRPVVPLQVAAGPTTAQSAAVQDALYAMSAQAGVIFAGQVVGIHRVSGVGTMLGTGSGWVEVDFQVVQAIRGCVGQGRYALREWAGLWAGGAQRYRVGERLLMLLHAPSASGLTSPVGGQDGAIPIMGEGAAPGPRDTFVTAGDEAVDLRWVATRVTRTNMGVERFHGRPVAPLEPVYVGRERTSLATRKEDVPDAAGPGETVDGSETADVAEGNPVDESGLRERSTLRSVLALLGAWEAEQTHAVR